MTGIRSTLEQGMIVVLLACVGLPAAGQDAPPAGPASPAELPVEIEFLGAVGEGVEARPESGWVLGLRLRVAAGATLESLQGSETLPRFGETAIFVLDDPDGCRSWIQSDACPLRDETWLEFTPDLSVASRDNSRGNPECLLSLTEIGGGGNPKLLVFDRATGRNDRLVPIGPDLGHVEDELSMRCYGEMSARGRPCTKDEDCPEGRTCRLAPTATDGFGLGADDDLPGLVLLADGGLGRVLDVNGNLTSPLSARNLAGLMFAVSYEGLDALGRHSILALTNQQGGTLSPVVFADRCVGAPPAAATGQRGCEDRPIFRIDGGQEVALWIDELWALLDENVITLRAFVVNGTAPATLTDWTGDGVADARDAVLAGHRLLSAEVVLRVRLHLDSRTDLLLPFDFDGNRFSGSDLEFQHSEPSAR